jgi:hypothetical protein
VLRVRAPDDGRGGADPAGGSGLVGLTDRVEALGGRLTVESPPGAGTALQVALPLTAPSWQAATAAVPGGTPPCIATACGHQQYRPARVNPAPPSRRRP